MRDPDPGSGAFLTPGSGMGKKSRSGSGMDIPDQISESLETIFWVKILKFVDADPEIFLTLTRDGKIRIRDKHPGSATLHRGHLLPSRAYWFDTSVENFKSSVPTGQRGDNLHQSQRGF